MDEGETPTAKSRFADWINEYGPRELATALGVSYWTVLSWRQKALGTRKDGLPKPDRLMDLLRLAKGRLKTSDIYPPKTKCKPETEQQTTK